ncbi:MAG: ATPase domain-containing protein [archaeon]
MAPKKTKTLKKKAKAVKPRKAISGASLIFDIKKIRREIAQKLRRGEIEDHEAQIIEQRAPATHAIENTRHKPNDKREPNIKTGVPGFDDLFESGIPQGSNVLMAGGAGSGKTIFCLQTLMYHAAQGEKCYYMSFEESEDRLIEHMKDFGWDPEKYIKKGNLIVKRYSPFEITTNVEAMLAKEKGELLIDLDPVLMPPKFRPDYIVLDSLTAVASAFTGKEDSYRIYVEQLFRFFEKLEATTFLITETKQIPEIFSTTGVEEFLADGVIVLYNIKRGDIRENAIEVLKMRGEKHQKKIVAMQITDEGVVIYPEQEVFGEI